jgi:hypothetical protein
LEKHRLLTTLLRLGEPTYLGVKVRAEIVPSEYSRSERVTARVVEALRNYLSPLSLLEDPEQYADLIGSDWEGWPFGRALYVAEIFSLIQRVPGVKHVLNVHLSVRPVVPAQESPPEASQEQGEAERTSLTPLSQNVLRVPANTLLCSLDHEIIVAELEEENE